MSVLNQENINDLLSKEIHVPELEEFCTHCVKLLEASEMRMASWKEMWDRADKVYTAEEFVTPDELDAEEQGHIPLLAVPITYAQIQTFAAFCFGTFFQKSTFFELEGVSPEDHSTSKLAELLLDRDLEKSAFSALLYEALLHIGRYGIGILKHSWVEESSFAFEERVSEDENGNQILTT